jgi:hypothetical protein
MFVTDRPPDPHRAERLARAARAAQALSEVLWEVLREELTDPRAEPVAELAEQLVAVASTIVSLSRWDVAGPHPGRWEPGERPVAGVSGESAPAGSEPAEGERFAAVLVDELAAHEDVEISSTRASRRTGTPADEPPWGSVGPAS